MAAKKPIASTQQHLDIDDIRDNIVILRNGNAVSILQTTAVNFDLLSEREQDSMIFAYAALLNSSLNLSKLPNFLFIASAILPFNLTFFFSIGHQKR